MENEEKKISVFGAAKLKTTAKSAKEDKPIVKATGLEQKLVEFSTLNGELSDAKAQLGAVTDEIKTISREKFVELYKQNKENPHTFLIQAGEECIMVIPSDKYEKVADEARAEQLIKEYGKDVVTISERFYFNPAVIERNGDAIKKLVDNLIVNAKNITEDDKKNLLTKEISFAITKGTIDNLVEYSKTSGNDIATVVENIRPIFQLKNCGGDDEVQKAAIGGPFKFLFPHSSKMWDALNAETPVITGWSECHWSPLYNDSTVCSVCGERAHALSDDELRDQMEGSEESEQLSEARHYAEGGPLSDELQEELAGLNAALPYVTGEEKDVIDARIKEIEELAKPKPKAKARVQAHEPASHTPAAPAETPVVEKKTVVEEKQPFTQPLTGMFSTAKVAPVKKKAKGEKITISIPELEAQIALRKTLKAEFEDLESQQSAMSSEIKQIAIEKFVELYKQSQKNPETFLIQDGQGCVMVLPVDNYIKIDEEKSRWLRGIYGDKIVTVSEFYYFNTEVLQRNQPAIEAIIGDAAISDQDKENLLLREVTYTVTKGLIDNMAGYGKQMSSLLEDVHPTFMLKACSEKKEMGGTFSTGGDLRDELILDVPVLMGYSNCCYAPIYGEADICTNCGEHCIVLSEDEARNEIAETANEMATGGSPTAKSIYPTKYTQDESFGEWFKENRESKALQDAFQQYRKDNVGPFLSYEEFAKWHHRYVFANGGKIRMSKSDMIMHDVLGFASRHANSEVVVLSYASYKATLKAAANKYPLKTFIKFATEAMPVSNKKYYPELRRDVLGISDAESVELQKSISGILMDWMRHPNELMPEEDIAKVEAFNKKVSFEAVYYALLRKKAVWTSRVIKGKTFPTGEAEVFFKDGVMVGIVQDNFNGDNGPGDWTIWWVTNGEVPSEKFIKELAKGKHFDEGTATTAVSEGEAIKALKKGSGSKKMAHGGVMTAQKEFEISSGDSVFWGMYHYEGNELFMDSCETMDEKGELVNVLDAATPATQHRAYTLLENETQDEIRGAGDYEYSKGGPLEVDFFKNLVAERKKFKGTDADFYVKTAKNAAKLTNPQLLKLLKFFEVDYGKKAYNDKDMLVDLLNNAAEDAWRFPKPYMGSAGDKVVVEKTGNGESALYHLTNAESFAKVDMFFNSPEKATGYAKVHGLIVVPQFSKKKDGGDLKGWEQRALDLKNTELAKLQKEEANSPTPKMEQWAHDSRPAKIKRLTSQIANLKKLIEKGPNLTWSKGGVEYAEGGGLKRPKMEDFLIKDNPGYDEIGYRNYQKAKREYIEFRKKNPFVKGPKLAEGGGLIPPRGTKTDFGTTVTQFRKPLAVVAVSIKGMSEAAVSAWISKFISSYIDTIVVGNDWAFLLGDSIEEIHRKAGPRIATGHRVTDYKNAYAITDRDVVINEDSIIEPGEDV